MEGYCWTCGWHTGAMTAPAGLDPATKMCRWCREHWSRTAARGSNPPGRPQFPQPPGQAPRRARPGTPAAPPSA